MKAPISNFSSQGFTHFDKKAHRLYIFTGKGGVGKTTISLAFTRYLKKQKVNAIYCPFDQNFNPALWGKTEDFLKLDKKSSMEQYIARKLSSNMIASWVMKSSFFNSMMDMLPSLSCLILLGDLLDRLEKNPDLTLVLDFPSTGHAMTLFESLANFKDIFSIGIIVEDIQRMNQIMMSDNFLKLFIISLPTAMAFHEAMELKDYLQASIFKNNEFVMNDSFIRIPGLKRSSFPAFFNAKLSCEENILNGHGHLFKAVFHHISKIEESLVVEHLSPLTGCLL